MVDTKIHGGFSVKIANLSRCYQLMKQARQATELNLTGLSILTEAASGFYILTPIIAALAGADCVYAITRDSRYGTAEAVQHETMSLAKLWDVEDRIRVITSREDSQIGQADIVTNLGFVRPLDSVFLSRLKETAVIPLMWETWEFRPADLDLAAARKIGIPVLGTNEQHTGLQIFGYIGMIALKLLFEAQIEIWRSTIVILGSGAFAETIRDTLQRSGAGVRYINVREQGSFRTDEIRSAVECADALVIAEHHDYRLLIGPDGQLSAELLFEINPALSIIHICGGVDRDSLEQVGLQCYPSRFAPAGYMSLSTDYVGPKSLIDLHTAGLKVGEVMARIRLNGAAALEAELMTLRQTPFAQGFSGYHDTQVKNL